MFKGLGIIALLFHAYTENMPHKIKKMKNSSQENAAF